MPRKDGTGPWGAGPMTGRGFGPCAGENEARYGYGFGRGFACRRGFGRGFGRGFAGPTNQKDLLQEQKNILQEQIQAIDKQLEDL